MSRPFALLVGFLLLATSATSAQDHPSLGHIDFPTSASGEAEEAFLEGVLFLHNFEYEDAATAFRRARTIDSTFGMAYWGEAMTYNHSLWADQDRDKANEVLSALASTVEERDAYFPTDREKAFHKAVETLYCNTEGSLGKSKEECDDLYSDEMRRMYEAYPDDDEVTAFYALSILGTAHEGRDFATYMRAAAVAFKVWERNQLHPGAAHYLIHSFDDPVHAPLGLPMARAYSKIAPSAAHAQHMTSHIFVALGMWDDVVQANEVAARVQNDRLAELGRPPNVCGHYTSWLEYGYLQQGRVGDAKAMLDACYARMSDSPRSGERWYFSAMLARYVLDTQDFDLVLDYPFEFDTGDDAGRDYHFVNALAAAKTGRISDAARHQVAMVEHAMDDDRMLPTLTHQIDGLIALYHGDVDRGVELLHDAAKEEEMLPFEYGPPDPPKPAYELLGESLVELGRSLEAQEAFKKQLARTINRTNSLAGLATAATELGDNATAAEATAKLAAIQRVPAMDGQ